MAILEGFFHLEVSSFPCALNVIFGYEDKFCQTPMDSMLDKAALPEAS